MKIYIFSKANGQKLYLNRNARVRNDLRIQFGGNYFTVNDGYSYNVSEVYAEKEINNTGAGAILGGLVGLLGGPVGLIIGAGLGGVIGNSSDEDEIRRVNTFNNSW